MCYTNLLIIIRIAIIQVGLMSNIFEFKPPKMSLKNYVHTFYIIRVIFMILREPVWRNPRFYFFSLFNFAN